MLPVLFRVPDAPSGPKVFIKKPLNIYVHLGWCAEQLYRESKVCDRSVKGRRRRVVDILTRVESLDIPIDIVEALTFSTNGHQATNGGPA
jgi:hypothetical protein